MAARKDNLPLSLRRDDDSTGTITYANEVIAIIAGVAANEVEGIAGMCTSGGIAEVFGRNRNITKGVKVEIGSEEASVDLYVIVEYGTPIQTAALNVQESVRKSIETMTGLHVVRVDVHVQGVSFEKENKEVQASLASAELEKVTAGDEPETAKTEETKGDKAKHGAEAADETKTGNEPKPDAEKPAEEKAAEDVPQAAAAEVKPAEETPAEAKESAEKTEPSKGKKPAAKVKGSAKTRQTPAARKTAGGKRTPKADKQAELVVPPEKPPEAEPAAEPGAEAKA